METANTVQVFSVSLPYGLPLSCRGGIILKLVFIVPMNIFKFYSGIIPFLVFILPSFSIMIVRFIFVDNLLLPVVYVPYDRVFYSLNIPQYMHSPADRMFYFVFFVFHIVLLQSVQP